MKKYKLFRVFRIAFILLVFCCTNLFSQNCSSLTAWHNSTSGAFLCSGSSWGTPTRVTYNGYYYDAKNFQFWNYTAGTEPSGTTANSAYWTYGGNCCSAGTANAGSGLSAICQGTTSAPMGGSIGGGASAGTWSGGSGSWTNASDPNGATYTAGASESGSITLTLTATGGCATVTATKNITINAKPTTVTVTGAGAVCSGASASLSASNGSSGTIYWQNTTSGGTSTATASTSQSVSSAGTYYFRAQENGCWGAEGSAVVTVNTLPTAVTVTGGGAICPGASASLSASNGSSGTIYWQNTTSGGTSTATASTSESASSAGTYYFRAQENGCWGTEGSAVVTVTSLPTPTFTAEPGATSCGNTDVTYTTESGKTNYIWTVPGVLGTDYSISSGGVGTSDNTVTLKWLTAGSKTVTINYSDNGCAGASATSSTPTTIPTILDGGNISW